MTELHVRAARAADQESIREVTLAAYQEYAPALLALWDPYRRDILATLATAKASEQIVAEAEGAVVGSVLLLPAGTVWTPEGLPSITLTKPEIRLLAVSPSQRGRGIGAALVAECLRRTRQSGSAMLTLHTLDIMPTAMRLYERMGFVRAPEFDLFPVPDIIVKGYRYSFDGA